MIRTVALPRLWSELKQAGGFDLIILQQIRADACCRPFFDTLTSAGAAWRIEPQGRCLRIDNHWANGAAFFGSLNKKGRNNHTRGKRILTELGGEVSFRVVEPDEPAEFSDQRDPSFERDLVAGKRSAITAARP